VEHTEKKHEQNHVDTHAMLIRRKKNEKKKNMGKEKRSRFGGMSCKGT